MKWLVLTVAVGMSIGSAATASPSPRKSSSLARELTRTPASTLSPLVVKQLLQPEQEPEFSVTAQTEVLFDGKPCAYQDVAAGASILRMEVGVDRTTVLKIHFRSRK